MSDIKERFEQEYGFDPSDDLIAWMHQLSLAFSDFCKALADAIPPETIAAINALADQLPQPADPHQQAYERSKRDRQRKARGGKYKWGGAADER